MAVVALTPSAVELHLEHLSIAPDRVVVVAQTIRPVVHCPACGSPATRARMTILVAARPPPVIQLQSTLFVTVQGSSQEHE